MTLLLRFLRTPEGIAGLVLLSLPVLAALLAPLLFSGDPLAIRGPALARPFSDAAFPLGTDRLGRDVLAGLLHGARASLAVGLATALAAVVIGALIGTVAGFSGGFVDEALMRLTEAFQTVPGFLLVLPNALPPVLALSAVIVANAILVEAALSFLGLGDPNVVTWGSMIAEGRNVLRSAPYLSVVPGLGLVVTVLGVHLVSEGLAEALAARKART